MSNIRKQLDKLKKQVGDDAPPVVGGGQPPNMPQKISEIRQFLSTNAHHFAAFQAQNELKTIMDKMDSFEKHIAR